jgi:hypothetical protein
VNWQKQICYSFSAVENIVTRCATSNSFQIVSCEAVRPSPYLKNFRHSPLGPDLNFFPTLPVHEPNIKHQAHMASTPSVPFHISCRYETEGAQKTSQPPQPAGHHQLDRHNTAEPVSSPSLSTENTTARELHPAVCDTVTATTSSPEDRNQAAGLSCETHWRCRPLIALKKNTTNSFSCHICLLIIAWSNAFV